MPVDNLNPNGDVQFPVLIALEESVAGAQRSFFYPIREAPCQQCHGSGQNGGGPCGDCEGTGSCYVPQQLTVEVPAGITDGTRIRVRGQGLLSADGHRYGDLLLVCYLRRHQVFKRDQFDLNLQRDLADGAPSQVQIPTLEGMAQLDVPADPGVACVRLPGCGLPRGGHSTERGDLVVWFNLLGDATEQSYAQAKDRARVALERRDFREVIDLLDDPRWTRWRDAEGSGLLGCAWLGLSEMQSAEVCLDRAAAEDWSNAAWCCALARAASERSDHVAAAVCYEMGLQRDPRNVQARGDLSRAVHLLFTSVAGDSPDVQTQEAYRLAQHRMYKSAATKLESLCHGTGNGFQLGFLAAVCKLLSACTDDELLVGEAASDLDGLRSLDPDHQAPPLAIAAAWRFARLQCGPSGLAAFALCELRRGRLEEARELLCLAATRARSAVRGAAKSNEERQAWILLQGLSATLEGIAGTALLTGLVELLKYHEVLSAGESADRAWLCLLRAVRHLELAACENPDDEAVLSHFEAALDLFDGLSAALLSETDPVLRSFEKDTREAAARELIPQAPVNELARSDRGTGQLHDACQTALRSLRDYTRSCLRGEFLVAAADGHYVLTNYRLLLTTDRLAAPQMVPLSVINRFTVRSEGINVACVLIHLGQGRQLALNNMPRGTYPDERLVNHVVAAGMWKRLVPAEQQVLQTGREYSPGSDDSGGNGGRVELLDTPPSQLPASTASTPFCHNCGQRARVGDLFCRNCGVKLRTRAPDDPKPMLGRGGNT